MAVFAISIDEPSDRRLRACRGRIARGLISIQPVNPEAVALEEYPPGLLDRGRVRQPAVVVVLDQIQVPPVRDRRAFHR